MRPALLGGGAARRAAPAGRVRRLRASSRFPTFTTAIYTEYQLGFDGARAGRARRSCWSRSASLAARRASCGRGQGRYARVGGGAAARAGPRPARPAATVPALARRSRGSSALALGVPLGALVYWLLSGSSTDAARRLDRRRGRLDRRARRVAAAALTALALPVALLAVRHRDARSRACSSAAPTSRGRCRASWSRSRSSSFAVAPRARALPDARCCSCRLRDPVPARWRWSRCAPRWRRPRRGSRRSPARSGPAAAARLPARHAAADRARPRRRGVARVPLVRDRADRHAAAAPDRHARRSPPASGRTARDARVRRGGAVRGADGRASRRCPPTCSCAGSTRCAGTCT